MHRSITTSAVLLVLLLSAALCVFADIAGVREEFGFLEESVGPEAMEVVEDPTIYRVADMQDLPCDAATFEFLLDRPKMSMVLARSVDPSVDDYLFKTLEDGSVHVDDHEGLTGTMQLMASEPGKRIYYMVGHYELFWGMTFDGRAVLVPEYEDVAAEEGEGARLNSNTRTYFKVESSFIGAMASFVDYAFPSKVDSRIARFSGAITAVTEAVAADPGGMYARLEESDRLSDGELAEYRGFFLDREKDTGGEG